jgi:hypothetical protein
MAKFFDIAEYREEAGTEYGAGIPPRPPRALLERKFFSVLIGAVLLLIATLYATGFLGASFPSVPRGSWQAVFLTNNQVYFGHVRAAAGEYVLLTDVFYLRVSQPLQQEAPNPPPLIELVKLGGELHGPEDAMYIPKNAILFFENMKPDSPVVQEIERFLSAAPQ